MFALSTRQSLCAEHLRLHSVFSLVQATSSGEFGRAHQSFTRTATLFSSKYVVLAGCERAQGDSPGRCMWYYCCCCCCCWRRRQLLPGFLKPSSAAAHCSMHICDAEECLSGRALRCGSGNVLFWLSLSGCSTREVGACPALQQYSSSLHQQQSSTYV